jgi:hypothetical protein
MNLLDILSRSTFSLLVTLFVVTTGPLSAEFTIRDMVISDTSSNLVDPKIDWLGNRIVWAEMSGVWIADIDPVSGDFMPKNSKGVLVDSTPTDARESKPRKTRICIVFSSDRRVGSHDRKTNSDAASNRIHDRCSANAAAPGYLP